MPHYSADRTPRMKRSPMPNRLLPAVTRRTNPFEEKHSTDKC
jgi:hypothetical protein